MVGIRVQIENSKGDVREVEIPLEVGDVTGTADVGNTEAKTYFPVETFDLNPENCTVAMGEELEPVAC